MVMSHYLTFLDLCLMEMVGKDSDQDCYSHTISWYWLMHSAYVGPLWEQIHWTDLHWCLCVFGFNLWKYSYLLLLELGYPNQPLLITGVEQLCLLPEHYYLWQRSFSLIQWVKTLYLMFPRHNCRDLLWNNSQLFVGRSYLSHQICFLQLLSDCLSC